MILPEDQFALFIKGTHAALVFNDQSAALTSITLFRKDADGR